MNQAISACTFSVMNTPVRYAPAGKFIQSIHHNRFELTYCTMMNNLLIFVMRFQYTACFLAAALVDDARFVIVRNEQLLCQHLFQEFCVFIEVL